jgi:cytochrome c oxidase cbb3-type subunit 3/ubiquinol-cytochrome c reductase cytochrome c subunit
LQHWGVAAAGAACLVALQLAGCRLPGKPGPNDIPQRPKQITNFATLYNTNCAACHGVDGQHGNAVSLANPAYLAYAGAQNIETITAQGIPGSLMPAFATEAGGLLTDAQIKVLTQDMISQWQRPLPDQASMPPYQSKATGNVQNGEQAYRTYCLKCHAPGSGSILDPTYLALISDGGLRTLIVAGKPEEGMPDWAGYGGKPLDDQTVADLVTFLASKRVATPGQPFPNGFGPTVPTNPAAHPPPSSAATAGKERSS